MPYRRDSMARRGVRKLEMYKHEVSGIEVAIYLNTHNSTFQCTVERDGEDFVDKDLNVLKRKLKTYLDGRVDLGWQWVIEVELESGGGDHRSQARKHVFGFSKKKYLLSSHRVNGKYLKTEPRDFTLQHVDYGNEEAHYLKDSKTWRWFRNEEEGDLVLPAKKDGGYRGTRVWLEYSAEVWAALQQMQDVIDGVAEQFDALIGTDEGYKNLEQIGREIMRLLPAPEEDV
jgi:hypothetical protein